MAEVQHRRGVRRPRRAPAHRPPTVVHVAPRAGGGSEALLAWACVFSAGAHLAVVLWLVQAGSLAAPVLLAVESGRSSIELRASIPSDGARQGESETPATEIVATSSSWEERARADAAVEPRIAAPSPFGAPFDCRSDAPPRQEIRGVVDLPRVAGPTSADVEPSLAPAPAVAVARAARADSPGGSGPLSEHTPPRAALGRPNADGGTGDSPAAPASPGSQATEGADVDDLPVAVSNPAPVYPPGLLAARVTGTVKLRIAIDLDGRVSQASVATTSGQEAFDRAALRAIRRWRFQPARRDGRPVAVEVVQRVKFVLPDERR